MTSLSAFVVSGVLAPLASNVPDPEDIKPGWIYAVVFFALCGVTVLLWLSMRKQLGKVRFGEESSSTDASTPADAADEASTKQDPPAS